MPDIAIPIVFPDYLIAVNTPKTRLQIPDLLPGLDILPDDIEIPETKNKFPELGHAGILFINGINGTIKYYEYGRYNGPWVTLESYLFAMLACRVATYQNYL